LDGIEAVSATQGLVEGVAKLLAAGKASERRFR
jgi:hypothetical protein